MYGEGRTTLNPSTFGAILYSPLESRPMLQTRRVSPGNLRPGVIICYDKIKRCASDPCSGYHKIVVLD